MHLPIDILEYHLIKLTPECFINVNRWARNLAIKELMNRRFDNAGIPFIDTIMVLAHHNIDLARSFIMLNNLLFNPLPHTTDRDVLNTYSTRNTRYIVWALMSIGECGLDSVQQLARYFGFKFSIYYAHELCNEYTYPEICDIVRVTIRHFHDVVPRYLMYMASVYTGGWIQHHNLLEAAMCIIETEFPHLCDSNVHDKLRERIEEDIETYRTHMQDMEHPWYPLR
jgi:hypothetical protein